MKAETVAMVSNPATVQEKRKSGVGKRLDQAGVERAVVSGIRIQSSSVNWLAAITPFQRLMSGDKNNAKKCGEQRCGLRYLHAEHMSIYSVSGSPPIDDLYTHS